MGKPNPRVTNGYRRRRLRDWWKAQGLPCALCGQPIDYSLPSGNPMSFEVDEVIPVSRGGDPLSRENTQPAHRICNQRKGDGTGRKKNRDQGAARVEGSRQWGF